MSGPARLERVVPFLVLTVFLDLVGFGIILPLLPSYVKSMGGDAQTVGVLLASFAAAQFVATPILGRASDRFGRRRVITISLGANVVAMTIFSAAAVRHALWLLFASRLLGGFTSGNISACQAAVADLSQGPARVRAMGKLGAGIGLGMMLGPWIGGQASKLGMAAPPLAAAILAAIALGGVLLFLPETNPAVVRDVDPKHVVPQRQKLHLGALASNPKIAIVMALYFLTFLYMTNLATALALLVHQRFDWTDDRVGNLFGLFGLVTLLTQFLIVGPLSSRVAAVFVVMGAAVLAAVGLTSIAVAPAPAGVIAGLVALATAVGLTQPTLAALTTQFAGPEQQGIVLGFAQSSGSLARTAGPILWGVLYRHYGGAASFLGGSVAAMLACAIALGVRGASDASVEPREREV